MLCFSFAMASLDERMAYHAGAQRMGMLIPHASSRYMFEEDNQVMFQKSWHELAVEGIVYLL